MRDRSEHAAPVRRGRPRWAVIGIDPNAAMLRRAAHRDVTACSTLLQVDATQVRPEDLAEVGVHEPVHAAVFAYSLSVMPH